jgi:hypothetical protein
VVSKGILASSKTSGATIAIYRAEIGTGMTPHSDVAGFYPDFSSEGKFWDEQRRDESGSSGLK